MNKTDMSHIVSARVGIPSKLALDAINATFEAIAKAMVSPDDGRVELRGFGTFFTKQRPAHEGHNPKTREVIQIPAKRVPFFRAGKDLKILVEL
jgi:DNA-binding protein HU-beta